MPYILDNFAREQTKTFPWVVQPDPFKVLTVGAISGLLGNLVKVRTPSGRSVYPNLFSLVIGKSGEMKSPYCRPIMNMIGEIEGEIIGKHYEHKTRHELKKKKDPEFKDDPVYPVDVPDKFLPLTSNNFTIEALMQDAAELTDGNMFGFHDEFLSVLKLARRTGREGDISFMNECYEPTSPTYNVRRKMKDAKIPIIYNHCLTLLGGLQMAGAQKYFDHYRRDGDGDGFFARFQNIYLIPDEKREWKEAEAPDPAMICAMDDFLRCVIAERVRQSKLPRYRSDEYCGDLKKQYYYDLDSEANKRWMLHLKELHTLSSTHANDQMVLEHFNKTATFTLKIALIFHLLKNPDQLFKDGCTIKKDTMDEAIKYVFKRLKDVVILYGDNEEEESSFKKTSDYLFKYLKNDNSRFYARYVKTGWTVRELIRSNSKALPRLRDGRVYKDKLQEILEYLVDQGKLFTLEEDDCVRYSLEPEFIEDRKIYGAVFFLKEKGEYFVKPKDWERTKDGKVKPASARAFFGLREDYDSPSAEDKDYWDEIDRRRTQALSDWDKRTSPGRKVEEWERPKWREEEFGRDAQRERRSGYSSQPKPGRPLWEDDELRDVTKKFLGERPPRREYRGSEPLPRAQSYSQRILKDRRSSREDDGGSGRLDPRERDEDTS